MQFIILDIHFMVEILIKFYNTLKDTPYNAVILCCKENNIFFKFF